MRVLFVLQHYVSNKDAFSYLTYFQGIPTLYVQLISAELAGNFGRDLWLYVVMSKQITGQFFKPFLHLPINPYLFTSRDFRSIATLHYLHTFVT